MNGNAPKSAPGFADTITRNTEKLAVLFADISGSTALYSTLGDNVARVVANACITMMIEVIDRFHGRVVKTIGDEVMCVFRRADDAVDAACEMQQAIDAKRPGGQHVRIHIGLHYGPVLVEGDDVFGDTVNTAAYLTSVAIAGQIMLTDTTQRNLSPEIKENARAVFTAVLKGATEESTVYQMIWHHDTDDLTSGNFNPRPAARGDVGSLIVNYRDTKVRMDSARAVLTVGRGEDCDIPVDESYASRIHASLKLIGDHFYLIDHSLNGTFVTLDGGEELHVRRDRLLIERSGSFALGRSEREGATGLITFTRDRRSLRAV